MDRLVRRNVLAITGRAVEAAGDCSTLLLDKTGTITLGNRQASEFLPLPGVDERELADAAQLSSLADETPEGRSIVVLAKERYGLREREVARRRARPVHRRDADERRRPGRQLGPQGRSRRNQALGRGRRRDSSARARRRSSRVSPARRDAARRGETTRSARRRPPEGRRQGGHARALRTSCARWASARS